jgi:hypothetical protein
MDEMDLMDKTGVKLASSLPSGGGFHKGEGAAFFLAGTPGLRSGGAGS